MKKLLLTILVCAILTLLLKVSATAEEALFIGDSLTSGICGYCGPEDTWYTLVTNHTGCSGCPCGDSTSQIAYWWSYYIGGNHTYYNAGKSYDTCALVNTRLSALITAHTPARIYVLCGAANVLYTSDTFADNQTYFDAMVTQANNAGATILFGNLPSRETVDKTRVLTWNSDLAAWAASKSPTITIIDYYSTLADQSTGDFKPAYNGCYNDHESVAGYTVMGQIAANAMAWTSATPVTMSGGFLVGTRIIGGQ